MKSLENYVKALSDGKISRRQFLAGMSAMMER